MTLFYLGADRARWVEQTDVPLFLTNRLLCDRRSLPRARGPWALDSGGYTELGLHGKWTITPARYAADVARYADEVGRLVFAAPQDWMTLPPLLAKTGLTVAGHQRRTVENLVELRTLAPDLPWAPALQGWTPDDYLRCADLYAAAGIDLEQEPVVGLGSIAARQHTEVARIIIRTVAQLGLRLHGFGVKGGLRASAQLLESSDSMSWSYDARRRAQKRRDGQPLPACGKRSCAHCLHYALTWREGVLDAAGRADDGVQGDLLLDC